MDNNNNIVVNLGHAFMGGEKTTTNQAKVLSGQWSFIVIAYAVLTIIVGVYFMWIHGWINDATDLNNQVSAVIVILGGFYAGRWIFRTHNNREIKEVTPGYYGVMKFIGTLINVWLEDGTYLFFKGLVDFVEVPTTPQDYNGKHESIETYDGVDLCVKTNGVMSVSDYFRFAKLTLSSKDAKDSSKQALPIEFIENVIVKALFSFFRGIRVDALQFLEGGGVHGTGGAGAKKDYQDMLNAAFLQYCAVALRSAEIDVTHNQAKHEIDIDATANYAIKLKDFFIRDINITDENVTDAFKRIAEERVDRESKLEEALNVTAIIGLLRNGNVGYLGKDGKMITAPVVDAAGNTTSPGHQEYFGGVGASFSQDQLMRAAERIVGLRKGEDLTTIAFDGDLGVPKALFASAAKWFSDNFGKKGKKK